LGVGEEEEIMSENIVGMYDITIMSKDAAKATAFYERLGFKKGHHKPGLTVFPVGNVEVAIHAAIPKDELGPANATSPGSVGISFIVEDVKPIAERLKAEAIPFVGPKPIHAGYSGLTTRDPDGNTINFFQRK
jgi:catechol 2,3-dioxygenase-like lactoylglutathione lyase family enzyme